MLLLIVIFSFYYTMSKTLVGSELYINKSFLVEWQIFNGCEHTVWFINREMGMITKNSRGIIKTYSIISSIY